MKDEYISIQAAIDAIVNCTNCGTPDELRKYVDKHSLENGWTGGVLDAMEAVEDIPAADIVVPVRCGECKHWSRENYGYCFVHASYGMAPDDFCSYGERREE